MPSAYNICKRFGPRSGPIELQSRSESNAFGTLIVFVKGFLKELILKKYKSRLFVVCGLHLQLHPTKQIKGHLCKYYGFCDS